MANEIVAADRWFYSVITGDATLAGIIGTKAFGHMVPIAQGGTAVVPPYVLWTMPDAPDDLLTFNAYRVWSNLLMAVRVVMAVESFTQMETGAAALDAVLHRKSGTNVSGTVVACIREAPFSLVEPREEGSQLRHLGGLYRLNVQ